MVWRSRKALVAGLSGSILLTGSVWAEVRSMPSSVERLVRDYMNHTPVSAIAPNGTLEQAVQFQQQFVQALIPQLGPIVGYKAALTSPVAQAVLWLKEDLRAAGIDLKPGDLLSLGTITPLTPVKEAMIIRARYEGLGEVSVTFK